MGDRRSEGTRPDAPTGGRLVIKRGAERDTDYYTARAERRPSIKDQAMPTPKRRRCLFCGRPMILLAVPVIVVVIFAARSQRSQLGSAFATVAGYSVTLEAVQDAQGTMAAVLIRPGNALAALLRRIPAAEPGSPVEILLSAQGAGDLPTLLSGKTPAANESTTILQTRLDTGALQGVEVLAEVSIGAETVALKCAAKPRESKP